MTNVFKATLFLCSTMLCLLPMQHASAQLPRHSAPCKHTKTKPAPFILTIPPDTKLIDHLTQCIHQIPLHQAWISGQGIVKHVTLSPLPGTNPPLNLTGDYLITHLNGYLDNNHPPTVHAQATLTDKSHHYLAGTLLEATTTSPVQLFIMPLSGGRKLPAHIRHLKHMA